MSAGSGCMLCSLVFSVLFGVWGFRTSQVSYAGDLHGFRIQSSKVWFLELRGWTGTLLGVLGLSFGMFGFG